MEWKNDELNIPNYITDYFQLIKLLFLSFVDSEDETSTGKSQSIAL